MIKSEIGINAGHIWSILNEKGEHSIKSLRKASKLPKENVYMAIGWLARESKVFLHKKHREIYVCLKDN